MSRRAKLSTRILVSQVVILFLTMCIGFGLYSWLTGGQLARQYQQRALSIAQAVAATPEVRQALLTNDISPTSQVQQLASRIQTSTGATFIVVINPSGVRLTHPLAELIGQRITEPVHTMDGETFTDIDPGKLGPSADGFAPVFDANGRVLGEVSAGIQEEQVHGALNSELLVIGLFTVLTLGLGALGALLLARHLKRITFGLELHEIARLLQEREAMLHGVREGVVTFDLRGNVTLINDEARRLIGVHAEALGHTLHELVPDERLREVLSGEQAGADQLVLTDERSLVVNRMSVRLANRPLGAVATLRDRTEVDELMQELTSSRGLTDALRAQQHEFANRMHTVSGLLELGRADEALSFLAETTGAADEFAESVSARIGHPVVAALILAKSTVATERAVTLLLSESSYLAEHLANSQMAQGIVTILGNLIDNAIDAAGLGPAPAHVTVRLVQTERELTIRVSDTGPGIPAGASLSIFREGFSTKESVAGAGRGIGLALVRRETRRMGGEITVTDGPGPVFTVVLPMLVTV
ncbi:MAG TPA: sensor histidine kinase [Pseudonocardiaceae bacterium]|jgi:two-component system CitB family sensor kinase|nr:sensor histidine kinase [Pseudonocardiaceae bacterium]